MDAPQFRDLIIAPTLSAIGLGGRAAENLLLGTALHESGHFKYLKQGWRKLSDGRGVARSFYGVEPDTARDLCQRHEARDLSRRLAVARGVWPWLGARAPLLQSLDKDDIAHLLLHDLRFATVMARLKYYFAPPPLPDADDVEGMAAYWGRWYQTQSNPVEMARWARSYREYAQ